MLRCTRHLAHGPPNLNDLVSFIKVNPIVTLLVLIDLRFLMGRSHKLMSWTLDTWRLILSKVTTSTAVVDLTWCDVRTIVIQDSSIAGPKMYSTLLIMYCTYDGSAILHFRHWDSHFNVCTIRVPTTESNLEFTSWRSAYSNVVFQYPHQLSLLDNPSLKLGLPSLTQSSDKFWLDLLLPPFPISLVVDDSILAASENAWNTTGRIIGLGEIAQAPSSKSICGSLN